MNYFFKISNINLPMISYLIMTDFVAPDLLDQNRLQGPPPRPAVQGAREHCGGGDWAQRGEESDQ